MTTNRLLLVAALVLFILAALVCFGMIASWTIATALGLGFTGLGCWVGAALA